MPSPDSAPAAAWPGPVWPGPYGPGEPSGDGPPRAARLGRPLRAVAVLALLVALAGCAPSPDPDRPPDLFPDARGPHRRVTAVARYTPATLYEYIDGQAPYVVSFGFVELTTADYRRGDEPVTTVDVYDMGSPQNAFALVRSNANLEAQPLAVGAGGAGGDGRVEFRKGRYYVAVSNPDAAEAHHVEALARRLADDLPDADGPPPCLAWLPTDGCIEKSEKFLPQAYLGYEPLADAASARYRLAPPGDADPGPDAAPAREATLFVCRYDSPAAAATALVAFRSQVGAQSTPAPLDAPALEAIGQAASADAVPDAVGPGPYGPGEPSGDGPPGATGGLPASASRDGQGAAVALESTGAAGAEASAEASPPPDGFIAERFVMGRLLIFRSGRFLAGMLPYDADPATLSLLSRLAQHLDGL